MSEQVEMEQEELGTVGTLNSEKKRFEVKKWNAVALWAWGNTSLFP
jgi:hypothetical protein